VTSKSLGISSNPIKIYEIEIFISALIFSYYTTLCIFHLEYIYIITLNIFLNFFLIAEKFPIFPLNLSMTDNLEVTNCDLQIKIKEGK
jgi:hypothetical protein